MRFTKIIVGGHILGLAVADKGIEITEQEYSDESMINNNIWSPDAYSAGWKEIA